MNWNIKAPNILKVKQFQKRLSIDETFAKILVNRGLNLDTAEAILNSPDKIIEDPMAIAGMNNVINEIMSNAWTPNTEIWVFADYDVDGMTSGYIMTEFLRKVTNNDVYVYYPNREEGYGLNNTFCQNLYAHKLADKVENILVITVDNGIACIDQIDYLIKRDIKAVVTDHHLPGGILPNCPVVDPHIDSYSAGKHLSGAGVAWKVIKEIENRLVGEKNIADNLLYAVAIGTVADVMPMAPENIALVKLGLAQLNGKQCPKAFTLWKEYMDKDAINSIDIAWDIAPRLNSCSRLGDIEKAAALFYLNNDTDKQDIMDCLVDIEEANEERKSYTKKAEKAIDKMDFSEDNVCVFDANNYPAGIAGVIAGKIADKLNKPALAFTGDDILIGSARSAGGISLPALFNNQVANGNLTGFGGHEAACGIELTRDKLRDLKASLNQAINDLVSVGQIEVVEPTLDIDCEIELSAINKAVYEMVSALPYDHNTFTEPTFMVRNLIVTNVRESKNNPNNICLSLKDENGRTAQIWAWKFGELYKALGEPKTIDLAGTVDVDFTNKRRFTMKVADIRPTEVVAKRRII